MLRAPRSRDCGWCVVTTKWPCKHLSHAADQIRLNRGWATGRRMCIRFSARVFRRRVVRMLTHTTMWLTEHVHGLYHRCLAYTKLSKLSFHVVKGGGFAGKREKRILNTWKCFCFTTFKISFFFTQKHSRFTFYFLNSNGNLL